MTSICYEVQDKSSGWLDEFCDNQLVAAPNGITGLDVTLRDAGDVHVRYQGFYGGKWQGEEGDGGKTGDGVQVFTAIRVLLSPRHSSHVRYRVVDEKFNVFEARDDKPAGNTTDGLRLIQIRFER